MRQPLFAVLLLALLGTVSGCREDRPAAPGPDLSEPAQIKKKFLVANDDPSRVFQETAYQYGPDGKLTKTEVFSYFNGQSKLSEYTEYTYDSTGRPARHTTYRLNNLPGPGLSLYSETIFEYKGDLLTRETVQSQFEQYEYTYEYAGDRLVKKSTVAGSSWLPYTEYAYDAAGQLTRETTYDDANGLVGYVEYAYQNGLRREQKSFKHDPVRQAPNLWTTVQYAYDARNRVTLEATTYVNPLSSATFPSVRYEYY
jgi:hypothetical protein